MILGDMASKDGFLKNKCARYKLVLKLCWEGVACKSYGWESF